MTKLEILSRLVADHAQAMRKARKLHDEYLEALRTWPLIELERSGWRMVAREAARAEATAQVKRGQLLAGLSRALGPGAPSPDMADVEALERELAGAPSRPASATSGSRVRRRRRCTLRDATRGTPPQRFARSRRRRLPRRCRGPD